MEEVARWHDVESGGTEYQQIVARARQQVGDPALTLSARILDEMSSKQQSFWQLALRYSRKWHQQHLDHPMSDAALETMAQEAALSLQRQRDIESHNSEPFEVYLSQFYAQYQSV
jgi:glutamate--cysteine ligase